MDGVSFTFSSLWYLSLLSGAREPVGECAVGDGREPNLEGGQDEGNPWLHNISTVVGFFFCV